MTVHALVISDVWYIFYKPKAYQVLLPLDVATLNYMAFTEGWDVAIRWSGWWSKPALSWCAWAWKIHSFRSMYCSSECTYVMWAMLYLDVRGSHVACHGKLWINLTGNRNPEKIFLIPCRIYAKTVENYSTLRLWIWRHPNLLVIWDGNCLPGNFLFKW